MSEFIQMAVIFLGEIDVDLLHYCERFLELLIDLEAQLLTRRFFSSLLDDSHAIVYSRLSSLSKRHDGKLFRQLLDMLQFYAGFEINDFTGEPLTDQEMTSLHYDRLKSLQVCHQSKQRSTENFFLL